MKFNLAFKILLGFTLTCLSLISVTGLASDEGVLASLVSSEGEYAATVTSSQVTAGSEVTVNWSAPTNHSANDYIRLAQVNFPDGNYYWSANLGTAASGSFNVTLPDSVTRFEFRLYRGSDNVRIAQSTTFVANKSNYSVAVNPLSIAGGGQLNITWNAPPGRPTTDRLVLMRISEPVLMTQQYTNGADPKALTMTAPIQPNQYEVQYFEANASGPSAISPAFTVQAPAGSFAGQVKKIPGEEYVSGALVEAVQNGIPKASATTNANGSYSLPLSSAGTYDVRVTAAGFPAAVRSGLSLSGGNVTVVNFELSNTGSLKGKVTKSVNGVNVVGASLQVKQGTAVIAAGVTDPLGNYNFDQLPAAVYSLHVSAGGFSPVSQTGVTVNTAQATTINVALAENQSAGSNNLEYIYDTVGRIAATKEQGVIKEIYNYDLSGNLLSITTPQGSSPAIISFSPGSGTIGTQVVIQGYNFAAGGQNTVNFNGTSAVINSSSANEIVTSVPVGATTGVISISTPNGTAASATPFVIGSSTANSPPTISSFSPLVGHLEDTVTIIGTNFETEPTDNNVLFGASEGRIVSSSANSLSVRANSSSGKISVTTPNGTAISNDEFIVVPPSIDLSKVHYTGRTWFGNNKWIHIPEGGKVGVVTFDAVAGKRFSLQLFSLSNSAVMDIYRPDGKLLSNAQFHYQSSPEYLFIDTQTVPLTGTYTIVIHPISNYPYGTGGPSSAVSCSMMIYDVPPDISGEIPVNSYKTVQIAVPGQNGLLTFSATAGQKIVMNIEDNTYSGFAAVRRVMTGNAAPPAPVLNYGFSMMSPNFSPDGTTIPATGTYNLELNPSGPSTGPMYVSLYTVPPDPTYSMNIGSSEVFYTTSRGQNAWIEFAGTAGQRISLRVRDVEYNGGFQISLNKPDGSFFATPRHAENGTFIDTLTLPATGTYKIFINPYGYSVGHTTIDLFDVPPDIVGSTAINGSPVSVVTAVPGHNPSITFEGLQGQQARVNITGATVPSGTSVLLRKPNGDVIYYGQVIDGTGIINSTTLPDAGIYVVEINPAGVSLGNATVSVGGDVFGTVNPGGNSGNITIDSPGQSAWLSFTGTAGQRVSAKLTNVTLAAGIVSFRKPDNSLLGTALSIGSNNNFLDTVTLPENGTYKILVDPDSAYTGSATINLYNVPPDAGGSLVVSGDSQNVASTVPGQNILFSFAGNANQKISLEIADVMIPGSASTVIKNPDGSILSSTGFGTAGTILNNVVLPETGNYQIFIDPYSDGIGSIRVQLFGAGTGTPNPAVQLSQSVTVRKESTSGVSSQVSSSVSVSKGTFFGNNKNVDSSASVSVRFGKIQSQSFASSVSVSKGIIVGSITPAQLVPNNTVTLTVSGSNLGGVTSIRFYKTDGTADSMFTVSNISVNSAGTILTATIQVSENALPGERNILLTNNVGGLSQSSGNGTNLITVVP